MGEDIFSKKYEKVNGQWVEVEEKTEVEEMNDNALARLQSEIQSNLESGELEQSVKKGLNIIKPFVYVLLGLSRIMGILAIIFVILGFMLLGALLYADDTENVLQILNAVKEYFFNR